MAKSGLHVSVEHFSVLLQSCMKNNDIVAGRLAYAAIVENGFQSNIKVGCQVIHMFASCGSAFEALQVFWSYHVKNVYVWTAVILAYAQHNQGEQAILLYNQMQMSAVKPSSYTFVAVVKACANIEDPDTGLMVHANIVDSGLETDVFVGSSLIGMYAKCGSLSNARKVFDKLPVRDVVSWNTMVTGYVQRELFCEAFKLFDKMQQEGVDPNETTFVCMFKTCASMTALNQGRLIHADVMKRELNLGAHLGSTVTDMYAKCGSIEDAYKVFDKLSWRDTVSWNTIVAGCVQHGNGQEALKLFYKMQKEGAEPNKITFVCILKACASIIDLNQGKVVHARIIQQHLELDLFVGSTLVDMYAKCGSLDDAFTVFDKLPQHDSSLWSAIITGCTENGHFEEALQLFKKMPQEVTEPDEITFVCVLRACAHIAALDQGKLIHIDSCKQGVESDPVVGSALVDMYVKCGRLEDACNVFDNLHKQNVVSWSAIISGYTQNGYCEEALLLFKNMKMEGTQPNTITFASILKACTSITSLDQGKLVHTDILRQGLELDPFVGSALVDMYAKCGTLENACRVFDMLPADTDIVLWNTMISGFANHGCCKAAQLYFNNMQLEGIQPNSVTFVNLLSSCSHSGLIQEGHHYFMSMREDYGLLPTIEHYVCMADLLGRAGCLKEAEDLVFKMPLQTCSVAWMALLGSCATYGNLEVGRRAFHILVDSNDTSSASYLLMSKIYAASMHRTQAEI